MLFKCLCGLYIVIVEYDGLIVGGGLLISAGNWNVLHGSNMITYFDYDYDL